jgi:hypothetical protein
VFIGCGRAFTPEREQQQEIICALIADLVSWLGTAGFEVVDLHWLLAGHAILSARKP